LLYNKLLIQILSAFRSIQGGFLQGRREYRIILMIMNKMAIITVLAFLCSMTGISKTYITREGEISFFSSAPLEDIEAVNNRVQALLDYNTGDIVIRMRIDDFQFPRALMQRHFNERFMESHLYPEARFSGTIEDFSEKMEQGNSVAAVAAGALTIHGVTRETEITGTIERHGPHLICKATFPVRVADYDIRIPRIFIRNIAEVVEVTVNFRLAPVDN
jgi:hypothetical protein